MWPSLAPRSLQSWQSWWWHAPSHHHGHHPLQMDHILAGARTRDARRVWGSLRSGWSCSRLGHPDWTLYIFHCCHWLLRQENNIPQIHHQILSEVWNKGNQISQWNNILHLKPTHVSEPREMDILLDHHNLVHPLEGTQLMEPELSKLFVGLKPLQILEII